ncbi:hypothetical protein B0H14DRAFT_2645152 [Mycena olivaceomarginata]|nr:hypothetical protein B0H14DRAFT_2645152 [Mycena olivaceomarginata]
MSVNQQSCFHVERSVSGLSRDSMMELQTLESYYDDTLPVRAGGHTQQVHTGAEPGDSARPHGKAFSNAEDAAGRVSPRAGGQRGWHRLGGAAYPPDRRGIGTFLFGDCTRVARLGTALHVLLNILSTLLLGAGNYCMQLLASPSRREADDAHARGAALDIGVPSINNLRHIDRRRVVGWSAIGVTATLLHLFWNSTIFTSLPVVSIPRAMATSDFREAEDDWSEIDHLSHLDWWRLPEGWGDTTFDLSPIYSMKTKAMNLTRLEPKDCLNESLDPLSSTSGWGYWTGGSDWLCSAYAVGDDNKRCNKQWADSLGDEWAVRVGPMNILVDYCLVGDAADNEGRCGLHHSTHIMIVVCVCTAVECLLILWTALHFHKSGKKKGGRTLVTMGDAISDFSGGADMRIATQQSGAWTCRRSGDWGSRPILTLILFPFWTTGHQEGVADLIGNILIANGRRSYSASSTSSTTTSDTAACGHRVEAAARLAPAGLQRFQLLPLAAMRYGVPLMANSILLHSLVSQSQFIVQTISFGPAARWLAPPRVRCLGQGLLGSWGAILALVLCTVSVLVLIAHSFAREYRDIPPGFQLMGLSSAAISLMCRRPEGGHRCASFFLCAWV